MLPRSELVPPQAFCPWLAQRVCRLRICSATHDAPPDILCFARPVAPFTPLFQMLHSLGIF